MTCGHCAGRITRAVKAADAAARIEVALPRHRVRVESALEPDEIAEAIRGAGYTPEPIKAAG